MGRLTQLREEVSFTAGRIIVRGKAVRELSILCDRLETKFETSRAAQAALLEMTLREALAG